MNADTQERRPYGFGLGLLTGTVIGAGLAMWLAPRAISELRGRVIDSARRFGRLVDEHRDEVTTAVVETADDLKRRGEVVRDNIAEAVAHHAHEVETYAETVKSNRVTAAKKRPSSDGVTPKSWMP